MRQTTLTRKAASGDRGGMTPSPEQIKAIQARLGWDNRRAAYEFRVHQRTWERYLQGQSKMPEVGWRWLTETAGVPEDWDPAFKAGNKAAR